MDTTLEHLRSLSAAEKLRIIEALWDDLCQEQGAPFVQAWQRDETRRRAAELADSPQIALTREEMWRSVDRGTE